METVTTKRQPSLHDLSCQSPAPSCPLPHSLSCPLPYPSSPLPHPATLLLTTYLDDASSPSLLQLARRLRHSVVAVSILLWPLNHANIFYPFHPCHYCLAGAPSPRLCQMSTGPQHLGERAFLLKPAFINIQSSSMLDRSMTNHSMSHLGRQV